MADVTSYMVVNSKKSIFLTFILMINHVHFVYLMSAPINLDMYAPTLLLTMYLCIIRTSSEISLAVFLSASAEYPFFERVYV